MRVVIAGSSGLIGTALVSELRRGGHDVVRLVRRAPAAPDERGWDPPTGRIDDGALDGADAVVNLCGIGPGARRFTGEYKQAMRDSRLIATDVLARAVAARQVSTMVNASASGYYGDTGAQEVDETARNGSGFMAELVRDWERATAPAADGGVRVVRLRSAPVISHSAGLLGSLRPVFALLLGGRLGSGRQYISWISLDDEVGATRFVLENDGVAGPVNLSAPTPVTNAEFTRVLAEEMRRPAPWMIPEFVPKILLGSEGAAETALISQRVAPAVLEKHGYDFRHRTLRDAFSAALGT